MSSWKKGVRVSTVPTEPESNEVPNESEEVRGSNGHRGPRRLRKFIESLPKGKTVTIWIDHRRPGVPRNTARGFLALFDGKVSGTLYMGEETVNLDAKMIVENRRVGNMVLCTITTPHPNKSFTCEFDPKRELPKAKTGRPRKEDADPDHSEDD